MRPSSERLLSLVTATLTAVCLAGATDARAEPADGEPEFRLHQSYKACGKKWLKRVARLSDEQREWMLRREHRLYTLRAEDHVLATLELLSTASIRDCDVAQKWSARETTIRVVYFEADGSRRTKLFHFGDDEVFFDRPPSFYPMLGKALLRGVTRDGRELARWLPLDELPALIAALQTPTPTAQLAQADPEAAGRVVEAPGGGM